MKKMFAMLAIAGAFTFASCGEKKSEEMSETTTTETTTMEGEGMMMDTTSTMMADSASTMMADSAKM